MIDNKIEVFAYSLYIKGIFGRNRKIKFQGFPLIKDSLRTYSLEELKPRIDLMLTKLKPKRPAWYKVVERPEKMEKLDGYTIRTCSLGSGNVLHEEHLL